MNARAAHPARRIADILADQGRSLAVAESLTGGILASRFAAAPGAAEWFRGGVVSYQRNVKHQVLDVPEGPVVSEPAAMAMARGVRALLDADVALSVTGAGGPDEQDGQPPGTVFVAVAIGDEDLATRLHRFDGDPAEICEQAADAAVALLLDVVADGG
jgi:nicotinamide-nucleotide amidase